MSWPDFNAIPVGDYVAHRETLADAYQAVRAHSRALTAPFSEAEHQLQSMPDASPAKWHLAHTTWFWETFILKPYKPDFAWVDEHYCYLFNSYYNAIGSQYPRPKRGLISHPDLAGVWDYRERIDDDLIGLLENCDDKVFAELAPTLVLGLNHEQQHQELIRTDIKHGLFQSAIVGQSNSGPVDSGDSGSSANPDEAISDHPDADRKLDPKFAADVSAETPSDVKSADETEWLRFKGGEAEIGYGGTGFCYDNELAPHRVLLQPFEIANRLVTAGEWLEFMEDGGYENPLLWLSDGWFWRRDNDIHAPLYWHKHDAQWHRFTFPCRSGFSRENSDPNPAGSGNSRRSGFSHDNSPAWTPINPTEPVRHISYYEADAFAEWRGARLPREAEWEAIIAARDNPLDDHGAAWEWTQSAYSAYPGFQPTAGLAGEYNGKFMVNQMVLRGGSPATSPFHSRPSYRNFFYPDARWQYTGLRLARDL